MPTAQGGPAPGEQSTLFVAHSQYYLIDPDVDVDPQLTYGGNGLVNAAPGVAVVLCGREWGDIQLTTQMRDSAPPPDLDGWDDVVEISVASPAGWLAVATINGPAGFAPLAASGPGAYRLRVHARHRDAAYEQDAAEPAIEQHLIIAWPAPTTPERVLKQTDNVGRELRSL